MNVDAASLASWEGLLWIGLFASAGLVLYVYGGYPAALALGRFLRGKREHQTAVIEPAVTLIIPAYNEIQVIRKKLENSLQLDYPCGRLEILVASDGSEDGTNEVVRDYESQGVILR